MYFEYITGLREIAVLFALEHQNPNNIRRKRQLINTIIIVNKYTGQ